MRNRIDFNLPPEDLFLDPARDRGLSLVNEPEFFWRSHQPALIEGFSASAHDEINEKIDSFVSLTRRHKAFSECIEINDVPVLLEQAEYRKSFSLAGGKCLLNGASGIRLQNNYCWSNQNAEDDPEIRLIDYFHRCQGLNSASSLPVLDTNIPAGIDFAIECRNTFNFYHFLTESLCQLCVLDDLEFQGNVFFHFPNHDDKTRAFARGFTEALFPELAGRVFFERAPKSYDHVLTSFNLVSSYYQFSAETFGSVDHLAPSDYLWKGRVASRSSQAVLSMNSFSSNLMKLRQRGLRAIRGRDFSHLPKRIYAGRDADMGRAREMDGEEELFDTLRLFGFEKLMFEHLSPLEQIALMANAEMLISRHGAGFANMLFANPETYVVELGTLQTAVFRWGDFRPLAHIAQCRYINFFADYNQEDPLTHPSFSTDGIVPVSLSQHGIGQVMAFVVTVLGHLPKLSNSADVLILARQLLRIRATNRAFDLLENHSDLVKGDVDLCLLKADCHKEQDEPKSELVALHIAYELDQSRWQTLVRIIWCARKCEMKKVMIWALKTLDTNFPDRFEVLAENREWMRQLI